MTIERGIDEATDAPFCLRPKENIATRGQCCRSPRTRSARCSTPFIRWQSCIPRRQLHAPPLDKVTDESSRIEAVQARGRDHINETERTSGFLQEHALRVYTICTIPHFRTVHPVAGLLTTSTHPICESSGNCTWILSGKGQILS